MTPFSDSQNYTNKTATATITASPGGLKGIFVATASAATLKVQDGAATIVNAFTPVAATYYPIPAKFGTSLVVTLTGAANYTVFWNPGQ